MMHYSQLTSGIITSYCIHIHFSPSNKSRDSFFFANTAGLYIHIYDASLIKKEERV